MPHAQEPKFWLLKTEPSVFSFEDLIHSPKHTTSWEGVRNYQARNFLRDQFNKGDKALIYHSNTDEPSVVGIAEVVREAYPDVTALDKKHRYCDPRIKRGQPSPWVMVDVKALQRFQSPVTRERMKAEPRLSKMVVLQRGSRLSVQPLTPEEFQVVCELGKVSFRQLISEPQADGPFS